MKTWNTNVLKKFPLGSGRSSVVKCWPSMCKALDSSLEKVSCLVIAGIFFNYLKTIR